MSKAEELGTEIATYLLTTGSGRKGNHLQIVEGTPPDAVYLAGWCESAVASRVAAILAPHLAGERPKIICLCGSTRFIEVFAIKTWELEREGNIVLGCTLLPMWYCKVPDHFGEATGTKTQCDELHLRKIDLADEVFVLNVEGYIGESTRREIEYALAHHKPVSYLEPLPAPPEGEQS